MEVNIIVLVGQFILSGILVWIALRKAPAEQNNLNSNTLRAYAETARIAGEDAKAARLEAQEANIRSDALEERLETIERKKYRVVVEFEIGEPPKIGIVKVEPIVPVVPMKKKPA